ncbi:uncharacterized protein [Montipora capricornis]|uniref:uncharacterized protein n=1 Tax=Montipora capricornis TaxID=246305 RepID=UPI0035F17DB3
MSSQILETAVNKLRRAYKAVLLQICHNLEKAQLQELRFYYSSPLAKQDDEALSILSSLEDTEKITWEDVTFLKEGLCAIERLDLAQKLTAFEIKRNLTILLGFYARKRQGLDSCCWLSASVRSIGEYLVNLTMELHRNRLDFTSGIRSIVDSKKSVKKVWVEFEENVERELSLPWRKLTFLVVIFGEILAFALMDEEDRSKDVIERLLSTVAEDLSGRMMKIGSWDEFCDHVEEINNLVYQQQTPQPDPDSLLVKHKIAELVRQMKESTCFL